MSKIFLAEDNVDVGETIVDWLKKERYFVDWEQDGQMSLDMLLSFKYDVVLLDWQLPGLQGPEICQRYRANGGAAPIIFLTDRGTVADKGMGFDAGADDYLPKPFDLRELSYRIKALLRRQPALVVGSLVIGPYELNAKDHSFSYKGEQVTLSPIEFALMEFFMKNENEVFSADAILDRVWPGSSERSANTLKTCIKRLREKIDADAKESSIQNVYGVGYKFKVKL